MLVRFADSTINIDTITSSLTSFNTVVLKEFGVLSNSRDFSMDDLETLKNVVKVFKLPLPANLESIVSENQKRQNAEIVDKSGSSMYPSDSFKIPPTPDLSESALSLKTSSTMMKKEETIDLSPTQLFELSTEEKWLYFQKSLSSNSIVKVHLKQEPESLNSTMINFVMSYNQDDFCDMMIFCEDLCAKMVECIEFWIQRNLQKQNVSFMLNLLGQIIKAANNSLDRLKVQDMLNRLSLVRILIKLFTQEGDFDTDFLYQIVELLTLLLSGGNRVSKSNQRLPRKQSTRVL